MAFAARVFSSAALACLLFAPAAAGAGDVVGPLAAPRPFVFPLLPPAPAPGPAVSLTQLDLVRTAGALLTRGRPCLCLSAHAKGETVAVTGFAASVEEASAASERLLALTAPLKVRVALTPLAPPYCALLALQGASPAPPGAAPRVRLNKPGGVYHDGERLAVAVTLGERGGYVSVDSYDLHSSVVHLAPLPRTKAEAAAPGQTILLGEAVAGAPPETQRSYTVSPPFGPGLIVVTVSERPLFSGERPEVEPAEAYAGAFEMAARGLRQNAAILITSIAYQTNPH